MAITWIGRWGVLLALSIQLNAQVAPAPVPDAEVEKKSREARAFIDQQNFFAALPLLTDLHQQRPTNNLYREELALCLIAKAGILPAQEASGLLTEAKTLLQQAQASGDNSPLLQVVMERLAQSSQPFVAKTPAQQTLIKGEKAFSSGDLAAAALLYQQAAEQDPKLYEAPLFAGDTEYKLNHFEASGRWYAKAIAIAPNRETAYRYWGDALMHSGDQKAAMDKFLDAIVAEPYTKAAWIGLQQWAQANHVLLAGPAIQLPPQPQPDANGNLRITVNPSGPHDTTIAAWVVYDMVPAQWRGGKFRQHYPAETSYRHSLPEQAESLRAVLAEVERQKISQDRLDNTLKSLHALEEDGMLECWILLNHADQGIAQDYPAYRESHRDLLHAYLARYIVHQQP
jgi:tetratricopeptide (TPR) repeat protein